MARELICIVMGFMTEYDIEAKVTLLDLEGAPYSRILARDLVRGVKGHVASVSRHIVLDNTSRHPLSLVYGVMCDIDEHMTLEVAVCTESEVQKQAERISQSRRGGISRLYSLRITDERGDIVCNPIRKPTKSETPSFHRATTHERGDGVD